MSLMDELVKVYDDNAHLAGVHDVEEANSILAPVGHFIQTAQIEITVNENGEFVHADVIPKEYQNTLMPCTQDSASRTSNLCAHTLCNQIRYIARDAVGYTGGSKVDKSSGKTAYELFIEILSLWVDYDRNPKLAAVQRYVLSHDVINDLVKHKILFVDDNGELIDKWASKDKDAPKPPIYTVLTGEVLKANVRWRVVGVDDVPDLRKDKKLHQSFISFYTDYLSKNGPKELCAVTGEILPLARVHSKSIRFSSDGAKLISSNSEEKADDLTFLGRFTSGDECLTVSYEASQKAHNALSWLIKTQGINIDGRVFLAWGQKGVKPPQILDSTPNLVRRRKRSANSTRPETMKQWADSLSLALSGYKHDFSRLETSKINVMVLDAVTNGRLSICYYDEMAGEDFIERIERWHTLGRWRQHGFDQEKKEWFVYFGMPSPKVLIDAIYGEKLSDKLRKNEVNKIVFSIINGTPPPRDLERKAVSRTMRRSTKESYLDWRSKLLEPTCSLVARRLNDKSKKEDYTVALDESCVDRSYLFGRLLAVADWAERSTCYGKERWGRETNASRFLEVFSQRPTATWKNLQNRIMPYLRQGDKYGGEYRKLIIRIGDMFSKDDFTSSRPLDSLFLLGYYTQHYAIEQMIAERVATKKNGIQGKDNEDGNDDEED